MNRDEILHRALVRLIAMCAHNRVLIDEELSRYPESTRGAAGSYYYLRSLRNNIRLMQEKQQEIIALQVLLERRKRDARAAAVSL